MLPLGEAKWVTVNLVPYDFSFILSSSRVSVPVGFQCSTEEMIPLDCHSIVGKIRWEYVVYGAQLLPQNEVRQGLTAVSRSSG